MPYCGAVQLGPNHYANHNVDNVGIDAASRLGFFLSYFQQYYYIETMLCLYYSAKAVHLIDKFVESMLLSDVQYASNNLIAKSLLANVCLFCFCFT
ncbi:hypothetical protein DERP_005899 [Dermatophagoides pteronyssinus]|uniref:Uncharacterized protein n=1 Tax=Dermatophagoides pteronyssinus TaxID=6956 RepID=A0ABQ8JRR8_DERPT|nr:hypothetical protein DERP_005899 [Dermatophagoides pteronyssinus]